MYEDVWNRQELLFKINILRDCVEVFESGDQYTDEKAAPDRQGR